MSDRRLRVRETGLDELEPWQGSPRLNDHAVETVARSIRIFGFNVPILCDQKMRIVAGHTRFKAAQKLGMKSVPAIQLHMSDAQSRAFAIADNKTGEIASWDVPKLKEVLDELRVEDQDLGDLGFTEEELRRLLPEDDLDENEAPQPPDLPLTRPGDLWDLGPHRLLCGDSRVRADFEQLLQGDPVEHVFAGPPYFNQRSYASWRKYENYLRDMKKVMVNCHRALRDGGVVAWNIGSGSSTHHDHVGHHSLLLEETGYRYLDGIVWVKSGANYSIPRNCHIQRNRCYYPAFQWEAILVFQKPGRMPKMTPQGVAYMSAHHTNVWQVPAVVKQTETYGHPAVCPVEIPYRCIQAYTGADAIVLEPFGGSGTTLIAAEKASRRALLIERDPAYCDVAIKRWEDLVGKRAKKVKR